MTRVVKLCDFLLSKGKPKTLRCPKCNSSRLEVIIVKHVNKFYICKLVCTSATCKRRVVYDVQCGSPEGR